MSHVPTTRPPGHGSFSQLSTTYDDQEYYRGVQRTSMIGGRGQKIASQIEARPVSPVSTLQGDGEYYEQYRPRAAQYPQDTARGVGEDETPFKNAPPIVPDRARPNYKPSALRWPMLLALLLALLGAMGLVVYAQRALPNERYKMEFRKRDLGDLVRRQASSGAPGASTAAIASPPPASTSLAPSPISTSLAPQPPTSTVITRVTTSTGGGGGGSDTSTRAQVTLSGTVPMYQPPQSHGNIGEQTVFTTRSVGVVPPNSHGNIGDQTVTTFLPTPPAESHGNIGDQSVTFVPTVAPESHGQIGGQTVTFVGGQTVTLVGGQPITLGTRPAGDQSVRLLSTPPPTPTFITLAPTTLTNSLGVATATFVSTPSPISTPRTTVLTDSAGKPTATLTTAALVTPIIATLTDSRGVPTATQTSFPVLPTNASQAGYRVFYLSAGAYATGLFIPTLIATLISIPIRIIDLNAKIFQPWHELTHPQGALGRESLCLETSGLHSIVASVRSLFGGQALVFLTTTLMLCAGVLIPLSTEAVTFSYVGDCAKGSGQGASNCAWVLSVYDRPSQAVLALLAFMALTLVFVAGFLWNWRSGVSTNPWGVAGVASLATNPEVRALFAALPPGVVAGDDGRVPQAMLREVLAERRFALGYFWGERGTLEYGIRLVQQYPEGHPLYMPLPRQTMDWEEEGETKPAAARTWRGHAHVQRRHHLPFLMLGWTARALFLLVLCGLLALILYYNNTGGDTPFEAFMSSEAFGVKFLFSAVGVVITLCWDAFNDSIAVVSPYQLLSAGSPQPAGRSILLSPPTNAFSGLWSALRRRHLFLAAVALVNILSEVLPILLANIPYRVVKTWTTHLVVTWACVGLLAVMILLVVGSFFVRWPHMPVDPSTVAGAMYYVCDSWMLERLEGVSVLGKRERDQRVAGMGMMYEYGEMTGRSGVRRVGIDIADGPTV